MALFKRRRPQEIVRIGQNVFVRVAADPGGANPPGAPVDPSEPTEDAELRPGTTEIDEAEEPVRGDGSRP